jgi:hypothetical protein
MKKIALLVPNNIWVSPYVSIYTRLLDSMGVEYETISWNREGREESGIQFQYIEKSRNQFVILWSYIKYARFLKKTIKKNGYERLVVFSPQIGLFLSSFLAKRYKGSYIFDYRDLSLEQKPIFAKRFKKVLSNSYANIISSPGFKKYLPTGFDYLISHNFNVDIVKKAIVEEAQPYEGEDTLVLTIGALRTDRNIEVMDALGNVPNIKLSFVGKGVSAGYLENYAKSKGYKNIVFTGFYKKEDEPDIIKNCTLINIVYPLIPSHISALSNRFYNSLIYKRPMIVTRNTAQGDYAQQYEVGLVVNDCNHLKDQIDEFRNNFDFQTYSKRCNTLLEEFLNEHQVFEDCVNCFCMAKR